MTDFAEATDRIYAVFGVPATHYASATDGGTPCTVLYSRQGQEQTDYGVVETASIQVRRSEIADPGRGHRFELDGRVWRAEYIMGSGDGTNKEETALACIDTTHMGMTAT